MKSFSIPLSICGFILLLLLTRTSRADIPGKAPLTRYTGLWTNSPFTSKPPPPATAEIANPLADFTLTGIAPVPGGYRVTIINRKNPEQKKVIEPSVRSEFKVISVNLDAGDPLATSVILSSGSMQGTVSFEKELLTLNSPPPPQQNPAQQNQQQPNQPPVPGLPPGVDPNQATNGNSPAVERRPRPRIVVPPPATPSPTPGGQQIQRQSRR